MSDTEKHKRYMSYSVSYAHHTEISTIIVDLPTNNLTRWQISYWYYDNQSALEFVSDNQICAMPTSKIHITNFIIFSALNFTMTKLQ